MRLPSVAAWLGGLLHPGCERCRYIPRQQFIDAIDRVLGDTFEHAPQVGFRIDVIEFGRADQRVDASGALAAGVGTSKEMIFTPKCDGSQRSLCRVVIELGPSVIAVSAECLPAGERVADGPGDL